MIFGHFIDFGHFPIEIPIEAEKFYGQQKEGSHIKNKTCFENQTPNGTTWNHVEIKIPNFVKIRITLLKHSSYTTNKAKNLSEFEMISQFSKNKYQI